VSGWSCSLQFCSLCSEMECATHAKLLFAQNAENVGLRAQKAALKDGNRAVQVRLLFMGM